MVVRTSSGGFAKLLICSIKCTVACRSVLAGGILLAKHLQLVTRKAQQQGDITTGCQQQCQAATAMPLILAASCIASMHSLNNVILVECL